MRDLLRVRPDASRTGWRASARSSCNAGALAARAAVLAVAAGPPSGRTSTVAAVACTPSEATASTPARRHSAHHRRRRELRQHQAELQLRGRRGGAPCVAQRVARFVADPGRIEFGEIRHRGIGRIAADLAGFVERAKCEQRLRTDSRERGELLGHAVPAQQHRVDSSLRESAARRARARPGRTPVPSSRQAGGDRAARRDRRSRDWRQRHGRVRPVSAPSGGRQPWRRSCRP